MGGTNVHSVGFESSTSELSDCKAAVDGEELRKHRARLASVGESKSKSSALSSGSHILKERKWTLEEKNALKSAKAKFAKGEHKWTKEEIAAYKKWQHSQQ